MLKAAERQYEVIEGFAQCLVDSRQPGKVRHTLEDLLGQRIFGIACGHPDANDADRLADDPIHKLLLGRDPIAGDALASQPTISRFENHVGRPALYRMARELAMSVVERPISTPPTTRPMARSSSPSSTGTTTAGVTCRCSRF